MNLNTHSSNETAIYSYVTPLNNTLTGLNQRPDISQPQTSYSNNYFQLSSNEKFEILKSISVSYANPYAVNQLVSSGQPLGHHYMSSPILSQQLPQVKTEYSEEEPPNTCDESGNYSGSYEQGSKEVTRMYQPLDAYSLKAVDASFSETSSQNSTSLAQKLVLAKINGSKYQISRGGKSKRGSKAGTSLAQYRVVKNETENCEDSMVVEPEYIPRTMNTCGEFDRSRFERTFQNYSMITGSAGRRPNATSAGGAAKKFTCDQCPKSFTLKQNLTYHVNSIHLGVRIKCEYCDKSFAHKPNLIAHMNSAHNGVRFKCDHCPKSFNQKPNLISHIKSVHEGIKYKCEECTKTFAQKQNLLSHVQAIHMGIKYTCEICSKSYNQVSNLLSHMSTVHQTPKHKCNDCGRIFSQEHTLRSHIASCHMDVVYESGGEMKSRRKPNEMSEASKSEDTRNEDKNEEEDLESEEDENLEERTYD